MAQYEWDRNQVETWVRPHRETDHADGHALGLAKRRGVLWDLPRL